MSRRCVFCQNKIRRVDFKETGFLSRFLTQWGKIKTRRETNSCAKHQRELANAIKNARYMGLMPYIKR
jgi:small subunit ribosomal protein S18